MSLKGYWAITSIWKSAKTAVKSTRPSLGCRLTGLGNMMTPRPPLSLAGNVVKSSRSMNLNSKINLGIVKGRSALVSATMSGRGGRLSGRSLWVRGCTPAPNAEKNSRTGLRSVNAYRSISAQRNAGRSGRARTRKDRITDRVGQRSGSLLKSAMGYANVAVPMVPKESSMFTTSPHCVNSMSRVRQIRLTILYYFAGLAMLKSRTDSPESPVGMGDVPWEDY